MAKKISSTDIFDKEDIFEGIRLSAQKTVEQLMEVDAEFKKLAQTTKDILGKSTTTTTKGIHDFTKATQDASKAVENSIKIEKLKAQAEQQALKAEQEREKVAQQKQRTAQAQAKEQDRLNKIQEKAAKIAANEGNAYKQLEKQARDLKNESKKLGAELLKLEQSGKRNSAEYNQLAAQYFETTSDAQKMDAQLKSLDKTVGDNQRNVGNYEGAVTNLKAELRKLTQEMMNMDEADPRFQEMATRAGELRDRMADTKAVIQATAGSAVENFGKAFARSGELATRAVQGVVSGMQLLGVEDEDTLKNIQKLQALGGLADSLGALGGLKDALTEIRTGLTAAAVKSGILIQKKTADITATVAQTAAENANTVAVTTNTVATEANIATSEVGNVVDAEGVLLTEASAIATAEETVATIANTGATVAEATATEVATGAQYAFNTALLANPVMLVVAGVTALAIGLYALYSRQQKVNEAQQRNKEINAARLKAQKEQAEYVSKEGVEFLKLASQLKQTNKDSAERSKLITEINGKYGTTLKNMADEASFQSAINAEVKAYIATLKLKFKAQSLNTAMQNNFNKQLQLEGDLQKANLRLVAAQASERQGQGPSARIQAEQDIKKISDELTATKGRFDAYAMSLQNSENRLDDLTNGGKKYVVSTDNVSGATDGATDSVKELNTEFEKNNEYISKQAELLNKLADIENKRKINILADSIEDEVDLQKDKVTKTGLFDLTEFQKLVEEKYRLEVDRILKISDFEQEQNLTDYEQDKKDRKQALDDEYNEKIKAAEGNAEAINLINKNYQKAQENLTADEAKIYQDMITENQIVTKDATNQIIDLEKDKLDFVESTNKDMLNSQKDFNKESTAESDKNNKSELEKLKETEQRKREIVKATSDLFNKLSQEKIAQYDKEIAAAEKQLDTLRGLAESGNINASESLAEQQRIIDEANRKKQQELQRQQRIKLAESVYSTYSQKVEAGSKNPLAETIRDTTLLQQFIGSLPTFMEGTENTGNNGKGIDGKGGFQAVLHPNERVIPKHLNEQIGAISNVDLARIAQEYKNGKIVEGGNQTKSALEFAVLVNELKDLKSVIQDKPETNIELGQITNSVMEIVQSQKRGNSVTYNRFKVRK
jgi:hypothetical protein